MITRVGVPSVARQAAAALTGNDVAWEFLLDPDGSEWLAKFKTKILLALPPPTAGAEEASLHAHVERLIDEPNMETLKQGADTIDRTPEHICIEIFDRAELGSVNRACVIVLDRICTELISQGPDDDGSWLVPPHKPSASCACCGLSFVEAPLLEGCEPTPYDPSSPIAQEGALADSDHLTRALLKRSLLPPKGHSGWVLWASLPCGHVLHDHCMTKVLMTRADAKEPTVCPHCGLQYSDVLHQWSYGKSGTLYELGYHDRSHGEPWEVKPSMDPRCFESLKAWTPNGVDPETWWQIPMDGTSVGGSSSSDFSTRHSERGHNHAAEARRRRRCELSLLLLEEAGHTDRLPGPSSSASAAFSTLAAGKGQCDSSSEVVVPVSPLLPALPLPHVHGDSGSVYSAASTHMRSEGSRHAVPGDTVNQATEAARQLLLSDGRSPAIGSRPSTPPPDAEAHAVYSNVRDGVFRFVRGLHVARHLPSAPESCMAPMEAVDAERWAASLTNQLIVDYNDDAYLLSLVRLESSRGEGGGGVGGVLSHDVVSQQVPYSPPIPRAWTLPTCLCAWQIDDMSCHDDVVKDSAQAEFALEVRRMIAKNDDRRARMQPDSDVSIGKMRGNKGANFMWVAEVNGYVHWPTHLLDTALERAH